MLQAKRLVLIDALLEKDSGQFRTLFDFSGLFVINSISKGSSAFSIQFR